MRYTLTAIHMRNFKTFRGEHSITNIPRLSFIIGPNGSGKTNVYDAVLFALLFPDTRIRKLDDYVSSGAPEGCWVSLTFSVLSPDGGDEAVEKATVETAVSFTREYKGNNNEIFKVTGHTCTREAYIARLQDIGIVGQRRIPSIYYINSDQLGENITAATITQYIESASGSWEYSDEYNLLSKEFLDAETKIKTQKTRLAFLSQRKDAAKRAEDENKKYAELNRNRELLLFKRFLLPLLYHKYSCQLIEPQILSLTAKHSNIDAAKTTLQSQIAELNANSLTMTRKIAEIEANAAQLESSLREYEAKRNDLVLQEQQLSTKIKNSHEQQLTYMDRKRQKEFEGVHIDESLKSVSKDLIEAEARLQYSSMAQKSVAQFFTDEYRHKQDEFRKLKATKYSRLTELRERYNKLQLRKEHEQREVDRLKEEVKTYTSRCNAAERVQKQYKRLLDETSAKINACNAEIERLKQQNTDIDKDKYANLLLLEQLRGKIDMANQLATNSKREEELRLSLKESKDAYPEDVKDLLKCMLTPVKKGYENLLRNALGTYQNAIVCASSAVAQKCITALKLKMRRPVMFLPSDTLRINDQATSADRAAATRFRYKHPGIDLQPFIEIVNVDKTAEKAAQFALRNTFYCDAAHEASVAEFAWKDGGGHRVILSNGVQLQPGGVISLDLSVEDSRTKGKNQDLARTTQAQVQRRTKDVPSTVSRKVISSESDIGRSSKEVEEMTTEEASLQYAKITQEQDALLEQAKRNMEQLQRLKYTDLVSYEGEYKRVEKSLTMATSQLMSLTTKLASITTSHEQLTGQYDTLIEECSKVADALCECEDAIWDEKEEYFASVVKQISAAIKNSIDPSLIRLREKSQLYLRDLEEEDQQQKDELMAQYAKLKETKYALEMRKQLATNFNYGEHINKLQQIVKDATENKAKVMAERSGIDGKIAEIKESLTACSVTSRDMVMQRNHAKDRITRLQSSLSQVSSELLQLRTQITVLQNTQRALYREVLHLCEIAFMTNTALIFDQEPEVLDTDTGAQTKGRTKKMRQGSAGNGNGSSDNNARCMALFDECQKILSSSEEDITDQAEDTCKALLMLPFSYRLVDPEGKLEKVYQTCMENDTLSHTERTEKLTAQYNALCSGLNELKIAMDQEFDAMDDYVAVDFNLKDLDQDLIKEAEELANLHKKRGKIHANLTAVTEKRRKLFLDCFDFLSKKLSAIYYELAYGDPTDEELPTKVASLTLTKRQTPWATDFIFTVFPPSGYAKEFVELSSGEKSVALLALLFCLHKYRYFPLLLMDEVDKNLDSRNTERLARYIHKATDLRAIAISHQTSMFSCSELLIGVTRVRTNQVEGNSAATGWKSAEIYLLDMGQYDDRP